MEEIKDYLVSFKTWAVAAAATAVAYLTGLLDSLIAFF